MQLKGRGGRQLAADAMPIGLCDALIRICRSSATTQHAAVDVSAVVMTSCIRAAVSDGSFETVRPGYLKWRYGSATDRSITNPRGAVQADGAAWSMPASKQMLAARPLRTFRRRSSCGSFTEQSEYLQTLIQFGGTYFFSLVRMPLLRPLWTRHRTRRWSLPD
ncbi:hypothetical protein [Caballeronia temeraria]|uniref:hypothetical protein n=1 Tax=Caballeronia temeraria TaxID=1777137 RepID=UPI0012FD2DDB|nr:hypothetical protein [Caballeronia temeraria]